MSKIKSFLSEEMYCDLITANARGMEMRFSGANGINYILELRPDLAVNSEDDIPATGFAEVEDPYMEIQRENAVAALDGGKF